jgi:hypothetical protein
MFPEMFQCKRGCARKSGPQALIYRGLGEASRSRRDSGGREAASDGSDRSDGSGAVGVEDEDDDERG